jgi:predicted amidohydrolase YtcJ
LGWYEQLGKFDTLGIVNPTGALDAAYAGHQEKVAGSLEPGKWADFIVIDRDLFKGPASDIHKTRVLQTWVAGHAVHQSVE